MMVQSCNNRHRYKHPEATTPINNSLEDAIGTTSGLNMDHAIKTSLTADNSLPINSSISEIGPCSVSMTVYNPSINFLNTNKLSSDSLNLMEMSNKNNKTLNYNCYGQVEQEINQMIDSIQINNRKQHSVTNFKIGPHIRRLFSTEQNTKIPLNRTISLMSFRQQRHSKKFQINSDQYRTKKTELKKTCPEYSNEHSF